MSSVGTVAKLLAAWPLWLLHGLGWLGGWMAWCLTPAYRRRWRHNTQLAGLSASQRWASVGEAGKQAAELPRLWFGAPVPVSWRGDEHIRAALQQGRGLLFLTPHLGCFEITAQAYARDFSSTPDGAGRSVTVLFRPPRKAALSEVLERARQRPGMKAVPTTLAGVKQLMQALKNGEAVGLLPDQVPPHGLGVWAPFFGEPAYTMTLSARLARTPGTQVLLIWGERLSWGRGYRLHVCPWEQVVPEPLSTDSVMAATQVNTAMEHLIRQCPQQYLWGYARYKAPKTKA